MLKLHDSWDTDAHGKCASVRQREIHVFRTPFAYEAPDRLLDTLIHELIHAVLFERGVPGKEHSERLIDLIAGGLTSIVRDPRNRALLAALGAEPNPDLEVSRERDDTVAEKPDRHSGF